MSKLGRSRLEASRHDRDTFSSIKRAVMGCFLRASREGTEGDSLELDTPASRNLIQKGIAIGAALGGAGLVPQIVVYGAEIMEGTQIAMERTLENEETSVVSLDEEEKEELKAEEEAVIFLESKETEDDESVLFFDAEDEEILLFSASASTSLSMSMSLVASASASMFASETASLAMSESDSVSESASESLSGYISESISFSVSQSESALMSETEEEEEEVSAAEEDVEEEDYYYYDEEEEEDEWDSPVQILEGLWDELIEEDAVDSVLEEEEAVEEKVDQTSLNLSASESASERSSMFTSIAIAASELQVEGRSNAARLESQYGLTDFTALANAVANENDAVRKSLAASITFSEGGSENMASILEARSQKLDVLASESAAVSDSVSAFESEAARAYFLMVQALGEISPAEII